MKLSVEQDEFLNYFLVLNTNIAKFQDIHYIVRLLNINLITLKYFLIQKYKINIREHKMSTFCYIDITSDELDKFKEYLNNLNVMLELEGVRNI